MKKLIAMRPIQYAGRVFECGNVLPACDGRMVEAWLSAGSAGWTDDGASAAGPVVRDATAEISANDQAADVLRAMGLAVEDDTGAFVGADALEAQIRSVAATHTAENSEMLAVHLDAAQMGRMTTDDLNKLAADLGVDLSTAKNNAERAAFIAKAEVCVPVGGRGGTL